MTFDTFMEELRKIPDKSILLQDDFSNYVVDFKIKDNHLLFILKNDYHKSHSIYSLARRLLLLENIKDVYVVYARSCYKVEFLCIDWNKVIIYSSSFSDINVSL